MQHAIQTFPAKRLTLAQPTDMVLVDPCYLIPAGLWGQFIDQLPCDETGGIAALHTGGFMLYGTTAYGDGFYGVTANPLQVGLIGDGAAVDSGLLCLVPADDAIALLGKHGKLPVGCALMIEDVIGEVNTNARGRFELPNMALVIDTATTDEVEAEAE